MQDLIELIRLVALAGGIWNTVACWPGAWRFRRTQNASTWLRAVICSLSFGTAMFQFSALILGNTGQSGVEALFSISIIAIGLMLGVWGERVGILRQLDKSECMFKNAASCQAMAELACLDPQAAADYAASIRADIARRSKR